MRSQAHPPRSIDSNPPIQAIPGMANAGFIMVLVMCIYAILAVEFFGEHGETGVYYNMYNDSTTAITARGLTYGDEYFGTFLRALFSLFQAYLPPTTAVLAAPAVSALSPP